MRGIAAWADVERAPGTAAAVVALRAAFRKRRLFIGCSIHDGDIQCQFFRAAKSKFTRRVHMTDPDAAALMGDERSPPKASAQPSVLPVLGHPVRFIHADRHDVPTANAYATTLDYSGKVVPQEGFEPPTHHYE